MKFNIKKVVIPLVIANLVVFILQIVLGNKFTQAFMLISSDVLTRPWILFTSMFLHGSANHILFNMYGLFMFGQFLEQKIGPKRFLAVYLASGIVASFLAQFFYPAALGASGAIMGMLGALIILMPNLRLLFLFFIPMPLWVAGIVWAFLDTFGIFFPSGVGNIAHLVGLGAGLLFGLYFKKQKTEYLKKFSSASHLNSEDIKEYLKSGKI
tara:strand:+ start:1330 stop:1962 length:633 start_codon:yes stop_codon:yes gene_type:complete